MANSLPKILCIGCSFTRGVDSDTPGGYPNYLSGEVVNLGFGGYGIWRHYINIDAYLLEHPSLLILQLMGPTRRPVNQEELEFCNDCIRKNDLSPCTGMLMERWSGESISPREFELMIMIDLEEYFDFRSKFPCPCIYFANRWGYPYYESFDLAEGIIQHSIHKDDNFVVTHFSSDSVISQKNQHPSDERNRITAELLDERIRSMLNA